MTFPGAGAQIYRNEDGEVLGWDYPDRDDRWDPDIWYEQQEEEDEDE